MRAGALSGYPMSADLRLGDRMGRTASPFPTLIGAILDSSLRKESAGMGYRRLIG